MLLGNSIGRPPISVVTANYAPNPKGGVDAGFWSVNQDAGTGETITRTASLPTSSGLPSGISTGLNFQTASLGVNVRYQTGASLSVVSGHTYSVSAYVYLTSITGGAVDLHCHNSSFANGGASSSYSTVGGSFARLTLTFTAGTTETMPNIYLHSTASAVNGIITAVLVEEAASPSSYRDGDTAGFSWSGTANESTTLSTAGGVPLAAVLQPCARASVI